MSTSKKLLISVEVVSVDKNDPLKDKAVFGHIKDHLKGLEVCSSEEGASFYVKKVRLTL